jgi:hypothetical protein
MRLLVGSLLGKFMLLLSCSGFYMHSAFGLNDNKLITFRGEQARLGDDQRWPCDKALEYLIL